MADEDPFDPIRRQQEQIRKMLESPALKVLEQQQARIRDLLEQPAIRQLREHHAQLIKKVATPPALRLMEEQNKRMQQIFESPVYRALRENRERWEAALTPQVITHIESYEGELVKRVVEVSESGEAIPSWAVLLYEIEGLLKSLELMTMGMGAAKLGLDAPVPDVLLALILMVIVAGELALWFAKGPPEDSDQNQE